MLVPTIVGLTKTFGFEASHQLLNYEGKCARVHGHSYRLKLTVLAPVRTAAESGVVVDFDVLKRAAHACVVDKYDHRHLNEFFPKPTAEIMVCHMARDLIAWFQNLHNNGNSYAFVYAVRLYETRTCYAEWRNPHANQLITSEPLKWPPSNVLLRDLP